MVRRNYRVELSAHRPHEDRISGERAGNAAGACGGGQDIRVLAAEPSTIPPVRIESAERDSGLGDSEHPDECGAGDCRGPHDRFAGQRFRNFPQR